MSDHQFIKDYLQDFIELLQPNDESIEQLIKVRNLLLETSSSKLRTLTSSLIIPSLGCKSSIKS